MQFRDRLLAIVVGCLAAWPAPAQTSGPVIRAEARLVLIDTVVTDKKGNYIRDLVAKDFRVWEDNKEQSLTTFSYESDAASPNRSRQHYLVLFFDISTMAATDQMAARQAAVKFLDANAGDPNRLIAIVNFGGVLRVAQNFTTDVEKLKRVASAVRLSTTSTAGPVEVAALGGPRLAGLERDFGVRSSILALRSLAKSLATMPGRKTLVLLTSGFLLTSENRPELTAAIDECNRANVSVYPIDVRGLVAGTPSGALRVPVQLASFVTAFAGQRPGGGNPGGGNPPGGSNPGGGGRGPGGGGSPGSGGPPTGPPGGGGRGTGGSTPGSPGSGTGSGSGGAKPGAGSGTPGGTPGGKAGGSTGNTGNTGRGGTGSPMNQPYYNPMSQPRVIIPIAPPSASVNQQVLYMLAEGTGGFVIVNTNDVLGGMQKIAREQNEYYVVGYSPAESSEGSCHTLRVKVNRGGTVVRARSGYCNAKPADLLAGKPPEKQLETLAAAAQPGNLSASMMLPYFYTAPNLVRVDVAMELPSDGFKFEKVKGKQHAEMNLLGIAYRPDGTVAGRFSDSLKIDLEDKKAVEAFRKEPLHYENQFEIAPGRYNLKVVFGASPEQFGKLEMALMIEAWDGKQVGLSGIALSKRFQPVSEMDTGLDAEMLEGRVPLVSAGLRFIPSGTGRFKKTDTAVMYLEVYAPDLARDPGTGVGVQIRTVDRKSGQAQPWAMVNISKYVRAGNPVVPVGLRLPMAMLAAGSYRAELKAVDAAGNASAVHSADFEVE